VSEIVKAPFPEPRDDGGYDVTVETDGGPKRAVVPAFAMTRQALFEKAVGASFPEAYGDPERDLFFQMLWVMQERGIAPSGIVTAGELMRRKREPLRFVVPRLIPEGTTLLAGAPKVGKSWLALQVGLAVAGGGDVLGHPVTDPGKVLYLALEDGERRLADRIGSLGGLRGDAGENLLTVTSWQPLDEGGLDLLRAYADGEQPRAILIDVLQQLRTPGARRGENAYERDYRALAKLRRLAADRPGLAVVAVHHFRKGESEDFVDAVSGSYGLTGVVDTVIGLKRTRGKPGGALQVTGRDVEDLDWVLSFDGARWSYVSDGEEVETDADRATVEALEFLQAELHAMAEEGEPPAAAIIMKRARTAGIGRNALDRAKKEMGLRSVREGDGWHWVPGTQPRMLGS
jgi:hypothetical protein